MTADSTFRRGLLSDLRSQSIGLITLLTGTVSYAWLILVMWPETGRFAPTLAWAGVALLIAVCTLSYLWRISNLMLASYLLTGGTFVVICCAFWGYAVPDLAYLFLIPVILASILISRGGSIGFALAGSAVILITDTHLMGLSPLSLFVWMPIGLVWLVTCTALLTASNLYTALAWMWNSYQLAVQNKELARDRQAELVRTLKALEDASYRLERANEVLSRARTQAEEARRIKQQFAQTISHELRTPLNIIVGFAQLMVQSPERYGMPLPQAYMRDLTVIYRNACHLQDLVNDVLDLARIEAASMGLVGGTP